MTFRPCPYMVVETQTIPHLRASSHPQEYSKQSHILTLQNASLGGIVEMVDKCLHDFSVGLGIEDTFHNSKLSL